MKYLGVDNSDGSCSLGVFDGSTRQFSQKSYIPMNRICVYLYHHLYKGRSIHMARSILRLYLSTKIKRHIARLGVGKKSRAILSGYFGKSVFNESVLSLKGSLGERVLVSDHIWGYINLVKLHPQFKYPALVMSSSTKHAVLAYFPNKRSILIIRDQTPLPSKEYDGLGILTIDKWVECLKESVHWPENPIKGTRNVYALYKERGEKGNVVVRMRKEIERSRSPFAEEVFSILFPKKMESLKKRYSSLEEYKNDWVASQQQLLRDVLTFVKGREIKRRRIKSFILTGGISNNPAFKKYSEWSISSPEFSGMQASGKAMAYLGYCINEEGLKIQHDRWKDAAWE